MQPRTLCTLGGGLYAGGTLAVPAVLLPALLGGVVPVVAGVAGVVGLLGGIALARRLEPSTIERFQGDLAVAVGLFGAPLVLLVATAAVHWQTGADRLFWWAMAGVFPALIGATVLVHAGERQHVRRLEADSACPVRLPGRYTRLRRQYGRWLVVGGVVAGVGYGYVLWTLLGVLNDVMWSINALATLWVGYSLVHNPERIVTDGGLVNGVSVTPWDRYEGFEFRDDSLVLHQTGGWGRQRQRFPLDAIDDPRAVTRALSEYLRPVSHDW